MPVCSLPIVAAGAVLLVLSPAAAQVKSYTVEVTGLSCPFSAFSLERRLSRIPGVADVRFDFRRSAVTINLAEAATVAPDVITETVQELDLRVSSLALEGRGSLRGRGEDLRISLGARLTVGVAGGDALPALTSLVTQGKRDVLVSGTLTRRGDRYVLAVSQASEIAQE